MDIQTPLIFVGLFSFASVVLVFIYKFGIKEKSYEEALAEQRMQTQILLGKPKNKEKKVKKPSKKIRQKSNSLSTENDIVEDNNAATSDNNEPSVGEASPKKHHVEFKEDTEEVAVKPVVPPKKQEKGKVKVKPILVQKGNESINMVNGTEKNALPPNHFEESHPKDDFELLRSVNTNHNEDHSKEHQDQSPKIEKSVKSSAKNEAKKQIHEPVATVASASAVNMTAKEKQSSTAAVVTTNGLIGNTGKEKKKKKSEFNTLQQLAGDTNGPNMSVLLNLVRKAELSRSEVQILIDLLLNKQHEAPEVLDEWSEGKSDPVQKLKKQLAEKERLWMEEKQLALSATNKLREIRAEIQNEKSQLQQKIRGFEEAFHAKQIEVQHLQQSYQQSQLQLKDEMGKNYNLHEKLQAMERQQIEICMSQTQELASVNNKLSMELNRKNEEFLLEKERTQTIIMQLQKELEQFAERSRQSEDGCLERERRIESLLKQENEYKSESLRLQSMLQQVNEEVRRLEHSKKQSLDEKQELNKIINQLKIDIKLVQDEKAHLQNAHMNGSLQESKQHQIEILNLRNQLSSLQTQLSQVQLETETKLQNSTALIDKLKSDLKEEQGKLEEQKQKNNETNIDKEFLQRLFPEIKELSELRNEEFKVECEKLIRKYISNLQIEEKIVEKVVVKEEKSDEVEVFQLKSQLQHYKNAIDNTEKILNKLQKHIEQEEINWRMQLAEKNAEIEELRAAKAQMNGLH